jgi:Flp pilus assembly protein TadG
LVLVFVDFGKFMNYWLDLTHVASFGARLAAVDADVSAAPYNSGLTLPAFIQRQAETSELRGATVTICTPGSDNAAGSPVRVLVSYNYRFIPFINRTMTLTGKATMRLEHTPTHYSAPPC